MKNLSKIVLTGLILIAGVQTTPAKASTPSIFSAITLPLGFASSGLVSFTRTCLHKPEKYRRDKFKNDILIFGFSSALTTAVAGADNFQNNKVELVAFAGLGFGAGVAGTYVGHVAGSGLFYLGNKLFN